jgi:50S ribosomal protein L16 3-hydroxylase
MTTLLGGLRPTRFLRDVRHKRPLLIRNAVPGFTGLLSPALAARAPARLARNRLTGDRL